MVNGLKNCIRRRGATLALACTAALTCLHIGGQASAQTPLSRFERQLEMIRRDTRQRIQPDVPADQRALIDYGGYLSQSFFAIDDIGQNTHILRQTDLNGFFRLNLDDAHRVFVRGRVGYQDFNSGDSFNGEGDQWIGPQLERAHYTFNLRRAYEAYQGESLDFNVRVKGGRQLVHWANGLVLSQELDGARGYLDWGGFTFEGFAGRTWDEQVDFDSSRPDFDDDTQRDFFGGKLSYELTPHHTPYVYGIVQRDRNENEPLNVLGSTTRFNYDSHYIGVGSTGDVTDNLRYGVEAVYQGGESLSFDPFGSQTTEDIQAWALDIRGDYLLNDPANTRFIGEVILASGDDDRGHTSNTFGGNTPGTDDNAFNGFGLVNTGLAFGPNASNLLLTRFGVSSYPLHGTEWFRRLQLGVDLFIFNKLDSDAPIDEPTSVDRYLGTEADFYANWKITSDLSFTTRYGVFFPGEAIQAEHDARHFVYTGITLGF